MAQLANEKRFDESLKCIGDLYEQGKDELNSMMIHYDADIKSRGRLFQILREMRDIACVNLKANHEIKDN